MERKITKQVKVGNVLIGGGAPVSVQSMLNKPAEDIEASVKQALELQAAGCQIIRSAVPNMDAVKLIEALKENLTVPVVADIHFDYRLALACADAGVDKIRINPGNIGSDDKVKAVADKCREKNIPISFYVFYFYPADRLKLLFFSAAEIASPSAMYAAFCFWI